MRMLTSLLGRNTKFAVGPVVILSLLTAYFVPGDTVWRLLSMGRVILLFPMFVAGYYVNEDFLEKLRRKRRLCAMGLPLGMLLEILALHFGNIPITWATHDQPMSVMECIWKYFFMVCAVIFFIGLAGLVPNKEGRLSRWGRNSIIVYLCHPFVVIIVCWLIRMSSIEGDVVLLVALLISALMITELLSGEWFMHIYNKVFNKIAGKQGLLRKP